jgi:hypothetical protein
MFPIPGAYNKKECTMKKTEVKRFDSLYSRHLKLLKIQGKSDSTIDAYSSAVRRLRDHFDRLGLQFFWQFVLKKEWQWIDIVKSPKVKSIPDILTPTEIERLVNATQKMCMWQSCCYLSFLAVAFSAFSFRCYAVNAVAFNAFRFAFFYFNAVDQADRPLTHNAAIHGHILSASEKNVLVKLYCYTGAFL